jgi:rare lipoprotein A
MFHYTLSRQRQSFALLSAVTGTLVVAIAIMLGASAAHAQQKNDWRKANASAPRTFSGMASYYGRESGNRTASGQRLNPSAMTAAHRTLPFGTKVKVTEPRSGRSVVVTINDRGPFIRGRVIDLSTGAASVIGIKSRGVGRVVAEVL